MCGFAAAAAAAAADAAAVFAEVVLRIVPHPQRAVFLLPAEGPET